jgi:hypothetical protein
MFRWYKSIRNKPPWPYKFSQNDRKNDQAGCTTVYLVPFWSKLDLQQMGRRKEWSGEQIEKKYYISGGCLRSFLLSEVEALDSLDDAFGLIGIKDTELFKTQYGATSNTQVDRIRMATVHTDELENYRVRRKWFYVNSSESALRKLGEMVKLSYYKEIYWRGYTINEMGIAFDNYFHTMARQKEEIVLQVRKYDRKQKKGKHNYQNVTFKSKESFLKGENEAECNEVMQTWPEGRLLVYIVP